MTADKKQLMKLNLPTVETCRWRNVSTGESLAYCGLVTTLVGDRTSSDSRVTREVCLSCCQSFPSSPNRLNPVVASIVYRAASQALRAGSTGGTDAEQAANALRLAEKQLPAAYPDSMQINPARDEGRCFYWGQGINPTVTPPVHQCHHPQHDTATIEICRYCRDWTSQSSISRRLSLEEMIPAPPRRSGSPVRDWAVAVTTAPRARPTLRTCLDSIVRAGWSDPQLFLDGTCRIPAEYNHLPVTWREQPIGAWPAWYAALRELVQQRPSADAYVMLQDDVVLYDRESLRQYLERCLWPGAKPGIVSLYYARADARVGWQTRQDAWHWSAQAIVLSSSAARDLLRDPAMMQLSLRAGIEHHVPVPTALARWSRRTATEVWYANPSLAQHIGNVSTIWGEAAMTDGRRASWYAGAVETPFEKDESLSDFPEHRFVCDQRHDLEYEQRLERGRQRMRRRTVVLCGLCRDVRLYLARLAARVERLGEMFCDYRVVIFENDSQDATREFLKDWQQTNPRVDLLGGTMEVPRYPQRRSRARARWMAYCRNQCREWINERYSHYDDIIVFDADLAGGWSFDGIANTFGYDAWDMVGSYGLATQCRRTPQGPLEHVDVWAFRPARGTEARKLVNHNELRLIRGQRLVPVESCFGGLAVYRMACMQAASYGGRDCEHVVFHERLRRSGFNRLYLNPSQIVMYSPIA